MATKILYSGSINITNNTHGLHDRWMIFNNGTWAIYDKNHNTVESNPENIFEWPNPIGTLHAHRATDGAFLGNITPKNKRWHHDGLDFATLEKAENHIIQKHQPPTILWESIRIVEENLALDLPALPPDMQGFLLLKPYTNNHWMLPYRLYRRMNAQPWAMVGIPSRHGMMSLTGLRTKGEQHLCQSVHFPRMTSKDPIRLLDRMLDQLWRGQYSAHARMIGEMDRKSLQSSYEKAKSLRKYLPKDVSIIKEYLKS